MITIRKLICLLFCYGILTTGCLANTIFFAYSNEPILNWDPALEFSSGVLILNNIYETLLRYDPQSGLAKPLLATNYEISDDKKIWTFNIRQNVFFHDGSKLDAEAVKFSIERTIRANSRASYIWSPVDDIEILDKYKLRFHLKYIAPLEKIVSCSYAAFIVSPKAVLSHRHNWLSAGNAVGTGPYLLRRFEAGEHVELSAFRNYWQGWQKHQFQQVTIKRISESRDRRQMLEAGQADITTSLAGADLKILKTMPNIEVRLEKSYMNLFLFFNTQKPPLSDVSFRRAISHLFPHDKIFLANRSGSIVRSHGVLPEGIFGYNPRLEPIPYNTDKARELLEASEYKSSNTPLLLTYASGNSEQFRVGKAFQAELAEVGITLNLQEMSWESQVQLARNVKTGNRQDIFMMFWWPDIVSPVSWLNNLYHSEADIEYNFSYVRSKALDQMIDQVRHLEVTNPRKAADLIRRIQRLIIEQAYSITVYDVKSSWAFSRKIKGFRYNPAYQDVLFFYDLSLEP